MRRFLLTAFLSASLLAGCTPNLVWVGPKNYSTPPTDTLFVENLGIDDSVAILPPAAMFTVSHDFTNTGNATAAGGYEIKEEIVQWVFQAVAGSAGWVPGDPDTHTIFADSVSGPTLSPGSVDSVSFGPIGPLNCGLYQQTLTLDADGDVGESNEQDNVETYFFFVPSTQQFNINVVEKVPTMFHRDGATNTHDFVVTPAGATAWVYGHFSYVATEGSSADTVPVPPAAGGPGPQNIMMVVTPRVHDIPSLGFQPTVTGKVTVISQDGCVVKQETARVFIEHE